MKITFIGDIMCEPWILENSRKKDGSYDFNGLFTHVKPFLAQSDYVVANMEFPLAGEEAEYTKSFYVFNAPDAFAEAIKNAGVDLVSTANNHTFDRNELGLHRTLEVLDRIGLAHTGSFHSGSERQEAHYFTVGDTKFAVIAYTYATNARKGRPNAEGELAGTVNILLPPGHTIYLPGVFHEPDWIDKKFKKLGEERCGRIKIWLGKPGNYPRADDNLDKEKMAPYIEQFESDIRAAKEKADVVIVYPHVGGQFNPQPGAISRYVIERAVASGADAVMAGHSHLVQKMEMKENIPCAYSLGNFSMSPGSSLMIQESLPGYSIAVHLYVEDKKIVKTTFSILSAVEKRHTQMQSFPVDTLYDTLKSKKAKAKLVQDVKQIYRTVTGKEMPGDTIAHEYDFPV